MIKAELMYNPYLGETSIKFNGKSPRINSLVEKYQGLILNDWIDKIPSIFCDEMNGYGFELDFSGTELDYKNIKESFERHGISNEQVPIFFKNELESRRVKEERIKKLLTWLEENPNERFDFQAFKEENRNLLDDLYVYKILQGEGIDTEALKNEDIAVEIIADVQELESTDLSNIPILVYISDRTVEDLQRNIHCLLMRNNVSLNQIFFYIEDKCDKEMISRTIVDLGVENPQIISSVYDEKIKAYFELYPISDYISQIINLTRSKTNSIQAELEGLNLDTQVSEKKAQIVVSDNMIQELKKVDETFSDRDNIEMPKGFQTAKTEFVDSLKTWRKKMTLLTNENEANVAAEEYEAIYNKAYQKFWLAINETLVQEEEAIAARYQSLYSSSGIDPDFKHSVKKTSKVDSFENQSIKDNLLAIRNENYVLQKEGLIEQVFKPSGTTKFMEKITRFYLTLWREHAAKSAAELADRENAARLDSLRQYADELAGAFRGRIAQLMGVESAKKDAEVSQLTEAERILQTDTDWLNTFVDQIKAIERG